MTLKTFLLVISFVFLLSYFGFQQYASARNQEIDSRKAALFLSPRIETVLVGSTFDVSFFLNTYKNSINTVELNLKFPPDKLSIVKPSEGKSFVSIWLEAPTYSNVKGTAEFMGGTPEGIITESGLVTKITFKAKVTGRAIVEVLPSSKVLAADGLGTNILSEFGRGIYTISPKPPEGVKVFSETHPSESEWYNNNSPILTWEKDVGISDFSFELDNKPLTIPDSTPDAQDTIKFYENLNDGLWYFHIKARKNNVWGSTTHFLLHVDTTPPAPFKPEIEVLTARIIGRALVSFSTTDSLSGIDHYEVGVIDKTEPPLESPVFVETQSPYQLSNFISGDLMVIVRAMDRTGNVRDEFVDVYVPSSLISFIQNNLMVFFIATLVIFFFWIIFHYLFEHKIITRLKRAFRLLKKEEENYDKRDESDKF